MREREESEEVRSRGAEKQKREKRGVHGRVEKVLTRNATIAKGGK